MEGTPTGADHLWLGAARCVAGSTVAGWRIFLRDHRPDLRAADLSTVRIPTFRTPYMLVFVAHGRRELVHPNVTASPTAAWIRRQFVAATSLGRHPVSRCATGTPSTAATSPAGAGSDRDRPRIETLLTPVRAPRANAVAQWLVGTLRRGCLDHLVFVNEAHLRAVMAESVRYDAADRPHRTLALETPISLARARAGPVRSRLVLGGLHPTYERAA